MKCAHVVAETVKRGLKGRNSFIRQVLPAKILYDFAEGVKADKRQGEK